MLYYWHSVANKLLTTLCNIMADTNLTDMETCYKAFRLSLVKSIPLRSNRFGIEPELTIKLAQRNSRIYEVPISYHGRTYADGKKIGLKDAVQAVFTILRYGLTRDIYVDDDKTILDSLADTPRFQPVDGRRHQTICRRPRARNRRRHRESYTTSGPAQISIHRDGYR